MKWIVPLIFLSFAFIGLYQKDMVAFWALLIMFKLQLMHQDVLNTQEDVDSLCRRKE